MEGTENSSNSGAGSQTESKSTESKATESKATETSKSSGNFSGGFDSSALSDKSLSTDSTPDFGVDFGSSNNNESFGFGDNVTTAPDLSHDNRSNRWDNIDDYERDVNGTYSFIGGNNRKPVMTVDEVYGKGNQSIVERQGDYAASSNEKSNVETSTFGNQDEISVTPTSVTEDKGLVNNDAIQSVEGLDFQQKDKAQSQDVLEAKKNRDEAEAEDKTNQMKDSLLANIGKPIGKPGNGDVSQFQLGEEVASKEKDAFIEAEKAYKDIEAKVTEKEAELAKAEEEFNDLDNAWFEVHQPRLKAAKDALSDVINAAIRYNEENGKTDPTYDISYLSEVAAEPENYADAAKVAEQLSEVPGLQGNKYLSSIKRCVTDVASVSKDFYEASQKHEEAQQRYNQLTYELADLMDSKEKAEAAYNKAKESYDANFIAENPAAEKSNDLQVKKDELAQLNKQLEEKNAEYEAARAEEVSIRNNAVQAQDYFYREFGNPNSDDFNEGATISVLASKPVLFENAKSKLANYAAKNGVEIGDISEISAGEYVGLLKETQAKVNMHYENLAEEANKRAVQAFLDSRDITKARDDAKQEYDNLSVAKPTITEEAPTTTLETPVEETPATTTLETPVEETPATTPTVTPTTKAPTAEVPSDISSDEAALNELRDDINNSDLSPKQKDELNGVLTDIEQSKLEVIEAAAKARSGNQADLVAWENATRKHTNNLTAALNMGNAITQTDLSRKFTKRIADANDFMVTREDGTQQSYADFATEEASKSPDYAEAIYNQQSEDYANKAATATNGIMKTYYNVKSELASWKAQLAKDWLGSKFIGADNAFRNTFIQMAETDERATVNTCNNILKDKTGKYSEADKKEALEELNQSKTLMTAATALKYSTGPFSGVGDDLKDGTYGTTNPEELKLHQKIISKVDNIAKIALGLVVTPAANEGWSNLYYLAGDKASQSNLFNRDWDKDGISMTREYGNNATAGMIGAVCELGLGVALMFNPSTTASGANLVVDSIKTFINSLYGVRKAAKNAVKANNEILGYFNEARDIVKSSGNEKAIKAIDDAASMLLTQTKQTEDFQLKSDEVGNLDNWLEGSGSNTADNGKFNQALTYDEWLKLIEADPVMREYAKSLNR